MPTAVPRLPERLTAPAPGWTTRADVVIIGSGIAGTLGVRRTSTSSLTTGEVVAVIGTGLVAVAFSVAEWLPLSPSLVVATLLAAGVAAAARQLRTQVLYLGAAGVTVLAWLSLVAVGLDRLFEVPTVRAEWAAGHAWPMLTRSMPTHWKICRTTAASWNWMLYRATPAPSMAAT